MQHRLGTNEFEGWLLNCFCPFSNCKVKVRAKAQPCIICKLIHHTPKTNLPRRRTYGGEIGVYHLSGRFPKGCGAYSSSSVQI